MKPTVYYMDKTTIELGCAACVKLAYAYAYTGEHKYVYTSPVCRYDAITGEFETANTIYKPATGKK